MKEKSPKKHSAQAIKDSYWDYQFVHFDPGSVEEADIAKQNFGAMARPYYVDIIYKCRRCKDEFTFEVKEQKVWYEEFGFHVDAHPVNCVDCRIKVR
ncbi:MAG: zinc-ribbon domain-containing protein [Lentisphaeria bacterium]|nr:zinc-ribbon domain-containing protein [Lentisphaeria bacterium]